MGIKQGQNQWTFWVKLGASIIFKIKLLLKAKPGQSMISLSTNWKSFHVKVSIHLTQ